MRIRTIKINKWRHFENIAVALDNTAPLICIVGANGTGKSHLLELIAACAHRLGLSPGIEIPRGDPFADPHDFFLQFYLAEAVSDAIDRGLSSNPVFGLWDRTLTIRSCNIPDNVVERIEAGGVTDERHSAQFASVVVETLRRSKDVHFLSLDADRSYPKRNLNINEVAQAYEIDWSTLEYTRGRSFKTSTTLYDEWIKYFLAQENQSGTHLIQGIRRAQKEGLPPPAFNDHFAEYAASLLKVLPHLLFTGVDSKKRTLLFDTTGLELSFNQLSGGEREIAFLVGQIDRFGLRQGIFLIDEPELHLNADLIRTWVGYLTGTVSAGQIWLATHSLEAVEAAGQHATFILERNERTRKVDSIARLDSRPVLSALSRAVGTPAFSISQLRFIFIEGEESVGERERFRKLTNVPQNVRFMECGSCNEVVRRVSTIKGLANEARTEIRIGGVVDQDFRCRAEVEELARAHGIFVLPVHEVENIFLHPQTLSFLLRQNGLENVSSTDLILGAADARAGSWIFQHAMSTTSAKALPEIQSPVKDRAKSLSWTNLSADVPNAILQIVRLSGYGACEQKTLEQILTVSVQLYASKREAPDLWKICEGKQVLNGIARAVGFADKPALISAVFALWQRDSTQVPEEVTALRSYVSAL